MDGDRDTVLRDRSNLRFQLQQLVLGSLGADLQRYHLTASVAKVGDTETLSGRDHRTKV